MATEIKVVLCGGSGCGKSGLIVRLITNKFMESYEATIEDKYSKILSVDGKEILLDILDTAGQQQFASMEQYWYREGEIFLVVYDITSRASFQQIRHFARKIADAKRFNLASPSSSPRPFVLVGNKIDLADKRQVETTEGQSLADSWNVPFFECSSYSQINLDELWQETVRLHFRILTETMTPTQLHQHRQKSIEEKKLAQQQQDKQSGTKTCCFCCKVKSVDEQHTKKATDNIKFYAVKEQPPDAIQPPVLALKNFRIKRAFNLKRFFIALLSGLILPIIIWLQTLAFLLYSENKEPWYFPEEYDYDRNHYSILLDYLGLIVGRYRPGQDPESVRDRRWFLRQTATQKIVRVILSLFVSLAFTISYYNTIQVRNQNVSRAETVGPLFLFWILWILLSSWIAFEPKINPPLPPLLLSRLRSITLIFGEHFTHYTSAYKFLRAYASARQQSYFLSASQYCVVLLLSALYALLPGITRKTVGDENDNITEKVFWTKENWPIEIGAFIVNFILVGVFIFAIEVQYSKHFDNYKDWMSDLTLLLSKEQLHGQYENDEGVDRRKKSTLRNVQELISMEKSQHLQPHQFGRDFSKHLFLSLTRRSNALGWLEIRSFLAIEGKLLFGEQELPTLFLMIGTLSLSFFILYRVYFIEGDSYRSILFNGAVVLMVICLVSLIRIAVTGYQFKSLQETQERLLGEQKLWMRCNVAQSIGVETAEVKKAGFDVFDPLTPQMSASSMMNQQPVPLEQEQKVEEEEKEQPETKETAQETEQVNCEEKEAQDMGADDDEFEDEEDVNMKDAESKPLLGVAEKSKVEMNGDVLARVDTTNWYTYNFGFVDDMLFIVKRKDIYPRLFRVKLDSVLGKAIAGVLFSSVITLFKVFF